MKDLSDVDFEDVILPFIFMIIGLGGYILLNNSVSGVDTGTWTFTGHEIAASVLPLITPLWLVGCILITGIGMWRALK